MELKRLNVGCGQSPTSGWVNYDNSWTVRISQSPFLLSISKVMGLIGPNQKSFIDQIEKNNILFANAAVFIPEQDGSVDILYSSHMYEHLSTYEAKKFFQEVMRVLKPGGVLRLAVPNLSWHVQNYNNDKDADRFIEGLHMHSTRPTRIIEWLKLTIVGERHHQWMYDELSMVRKLDEAGFKSPKVMPAGSTSISDPGALSLSERSPESLFVEAVRS